MLVAVCLVLRTSGPADARQPADPSVAPEAQTEIDKCETLRAPIEAMLGTLSSAPRRVTSFVQDMPTLSCDYRADAAWVTVVIVMGQDRAQF